VIVLPLEQVNSGRQYFNWSNQVMLQFIDIFVSWQVEKGVDEALFIKLAFKGVCGHSNLQEG